MMSKLPKRVVWAIVAVVALAGLATLAGIFWSRSARPDRTAKRAPSDLFTPRTAGNTPAPLPPTSSPHWPTRAPNAEHDHPSGDEHVQRSARRALQRANQDPFSKVTDAVSFILQDVALGEAGRSQRKELEARLLLALDRADWGKAKARRQASSAAIATILKRAADQPSAKLDHARAQAIKALAHVIAGELYRDLALANARPTAADQTKPGPSGRSTVSWRLLGGFAYRKGEPLPAAVRALDGAEVVIDGYMLTLTETNNIRSFLLVESLWGCFGKPPGLHQGIVVRLSSGPALEYLFTPIQVSGRLEVGEKMESGHVTSVYRIIEI